MHELSQFCGVLIHLPRRNSAQSYASHVISNSWALLVSQELSCAIVSYLRVISESVCMSLFKSTLGLGARSLVDLYGLVAFLRLNPLAERRLFVRTLERPIKSGEPLGLMRLQVAPPGCYPHDLHSACYACAPHMRVRVRRI